MKTGSIGLFSKTERGHLVVEFAIVLPVLLMVAFVGLEFSRAMRSKQVVQTLSRESASIVFRECGVRTSNRTTDCLNRVRDDILGLTGIAGAELVLSIYQFDGTVMNFGPVGGGFSKFTVSKLNSPGDITGALVRSHRVIVIAEAQVPNQTLVSRFGAGLQLTLTTEPFYDATVL